ncbi:unnamed protein product [Caenorhabditis angaria]|uniref:Uncharacterized protein n=1 Tax=Caenorhabditis angaria TaxID=860376 RepID=A0A9P1N858_9PELO|nr:unnamed protein product [Caenorhabditis angaria]
MDHPRRGNHPDNNARRELHVDAHSRDVSMSTNRSQSNDFEFFAPSPGSSIGASVSMFSSRNSEVDLGEAEELDGVRTIILHHGVDDMLRDVEIHNRYPAFYKFLTDEDPSWYEPSSLNGTVFRVAKKTMEPREIPNRSRNEIKYEMLDLMYRFYQQKQINASMKREADELKEANRQLRAASVQIYAKAEQEEEFISNSLMKKIQKLKEDKEYLVEKYHRDEESLTSDLMANVAKIAEIHQDQCKTEKLVADKQAEIDRLKEHCRRAEKHFQQELFRLRTEKVDHESALEQEQEHLINTLGKRISLTNEENRKMQASLEQAYLNGFVDYDSGVKCALRAIAAEKYGSMTSPSQTLRQGAPSPMGGAAFQPVQLTEQAQLYEETQRLSGHIQKLHKKNTYYRKREQDLTIEVMKLQQQLDSIRLETRNFEMALNSRINTFCNKVLGDEVKPNTSVVAPQPSTSTAPQPVQSIVHPMPAQQPPTAFATVFPIQRSPSSRHDMNTM